VKLEIAVEGSGQAAVDDAFNAPPPPVVMSQKRRTSEVFRPGAGSNRAPPPFPINHCRQRVPHSSPRHATSSEGSRRLQCPPSISATVAMPGLKVPAQPPAPPVEDEEEEPPPPEPPLVPPERALVTGIVPIVLTDPRALRQTYIGELSIELPADGASATFVDEGQLLISHGVDLCRMCDCTNRL
jgi:hypothetical protein